MIDQMWLALLVEVTGIFTRVERIGLKIGREWAMFPNTFFRVTLDYFVMFPRILCWCNGQCWVVMSYEPLNRFATGVRNGVFVFC